MKTNYVIPQIEVIEIEIEDAILVDGGSGVGGGSIPSVVPGNLE